MPGAIMKKCLTLKWENDDEKEARKSQKEQPGKNIMQYEISDKIKKRKKELHETCNNF